MNERSVISWEDWINPFLLIIGTGVMVFITATALPTFSLFCLVVGWYLFNKAMNAMEAKITRAELRRANQRR